MVKSKAKAVKQVKPGKQAPRSTASLETADPLSAAAETLPALSAAPKGARSSEYVVLSLVKRNKQYYRKDSILLLTDAEAAPLLKHKAIELINE